MSKTLLYEAPDISYHNGIVDIKRVRDAGCKCIGIRAGYGKNNIDQKYIANAEACYNLGVEPLLYWFSYAYTADMAASEARYAVAQAAKYWNKCPIAYDFEYDSVNYARKNGVNVTKELATDMAIAFLETVRDLGYIPVLYTNRDYLQNYFDADRIVSAVGTVYIWYARYTSSLPESEAKNADIWQYTSSGRVSGINGNVDMNKFYTDFDAAIVNNEREDKSNLNIADFQKAANAAGLRDANGNKLAEDGIDGSNTQYVRKQVALKAKFKNGKYSVGSTGELVKWWQSRCNEILGHMQEVDGMFGQIARAETVELQKKLGLKVDGIVGYNSIQAVFYN